MIHRLTGFFQISFMKSILIHLRSILFALADGNFVVPILGNPANGLKRESYTHQK